MAPGRGLRARFLRLPRDIEQKRVPTVVADRCAMLAGMGTTHLGLLRRVEEHPRVIEGLEAVFGADERVLLAQFRHPPPHPRPVCRDFAGHGAPIRRKQDRGLRTED